MGFARTGWCDPRVDEEALELGHIEELETLGRQYTDELVQLVARFEKDRALSIARHELARERLWREGAVGDPTGDTRGREQRKEPS
jgi:hypothetical protein